jgi:hypothetical protein
VDDAEEAQFGQLPGPPLVRRSLLQPTLKITTRRTGVGWLMPL